MSQDRAHVPKWQFCPSHRKFINFSKNNSKATMLSMEFLYQETWEGCYVMLLEGDDKNARANVSSSEWENQNECIDVSECFDFSRQLLPAG